jgi:hypothetical protein
MIVRLLRIERASAEESARYARRVAKAPISPLTVADCPHCGWRNYPSPVPINGNQFHVDWHLPASCARCGTTLGPDSGPYAREGGVGAKRRFPIWGMRKPCTFATSRHSAAEGRHASDWSGGQKVPGSNPGAPTA